MTTVAASQVPKLQFFNPSTGAPLAGGLLFTYAAGTTTKQVTYSNPDNLTPNANPIVLDATGSCVCFLDVTLQYEFTLSPPGDTDPPTNPIYSVDQLGFADLTQGLAPLASPAFTGEPTAPTPAAGDNSTSIATTQFIAETITAALNNTALIGTPTAPTPASGDDTTKIATTAFVAAAITAASPSLPTGGITQTSNSVQIGKLLFQFGTGSAPSSGSHTTSANVAFGTAYATPLYANVMVSSASFSTSNYLAATAITSLSGTGFTAQMDTNSSDGTNGNITAAVPFNWVAVGIVA